MNEARLLGADGVLRIVPLGVALSKEGAGMLHEHLKRG